ncbi:hypothetical protein OGAPHI_003005 [Ogataea philodendri]|uniref:Uncharacterized protein n=1 Tax=Ogataea philodendri TaxID=1378263 RepID=A0A9P8T6W7_9ASCO|nr:uncharacterized protein OGAPHI_003005 [Ogataea philodendri]KAH3667356.1 hypothetical protein OGAPHI_003005 [Ogataea philodendri]
MSCSWLSSNFGSSSGKHATGSILKKSDSSARAALNRLRGSIVSKPDNRRKHAGVIMAPYSLSNVRWYSTWRLTPFLLISSAFGKTSGVGDPSSLKIMSAWSRSLFPSRIGFFLNISPKTHPIPHMSTAVVYLRSPSNSSGGRYHRVTTSPVYSTSPPPAPDEASLGGGPWYTLASPKSAILTTPNQSSKMFAVLMSLCK